MLVSRERHILIKILANEGRGCVFSLTFHQEVEFLGHGVGMLKKPVNKC